MPDRKWVERLGEFLAANPGKPVVVTVNGAQVTIRDVRTEGGHIKVVIVQANDS